MRYSNPSNRRGNVLILFALLLFVLFAMAALVIDLGFAMVTRREMQTAVDTAALEGLRGRDDPSIKDSQERNFSRRQTAQSLVHLVFGDYRDPNNGNTLQFGAGPLLEPKNGIALPGTSFRAAQTLDDPGNGQIPVYKPRMEINLDNRLEGDMVAGTYLGSNSSLSVDPTFEENQEYDRQDFVLVDPTNSPKADAFLVRLRRTNDLQGLDNIPGVSSNGQPLPYLFGRGSLLNPEAKARGITVRATAIAQARPAVSVGVPFAELNPPLPGVTPFGLDRLALWDSPNFTPQSSLNATVDPRGNITITSPGFSAPPQGLFFSTPLTSIGQEVIEPAPVSENLKFPITGYVPIFQVVENSTGQKPLTRVIGFGRITMILAQGTPGQTPLNVQLMKLPSIIAPENASAVLAYPFAVTDQTEALNVFEALKNFHDPLLAPALVR